MTPYYDENGITIYHGDVLEVSALLDRESVDTIVTSPPYNQLDERVAVSGVNRGMYQNNAWLHKVEATGYADDLSEGEYAEWQATVADHLWFITKPGGSFFYNHKLRYRDSKPVHPLHLVESFAGWWLRQEIVWDRRGSMVFNARMFAPSDERIYWLVREGAPHNWNQDAAGFLSVWQMNPPGGSHHPCPFPPWCISASLRRLTPAVLFSTHSWAQGPHWRQLRRLVVALSALRSKSATARSRCSVSLKVFLLWRHLMFERPWFAFVFWGLVIVEAAVVEGWV